VVLRNSVVGPHVSIGDGCLIENAVLKNSIIQKNTKIRNTILNNSMIGMSAEYNGQAKELSFGDFSVEK